MTTSTKYDVLIIGGGVSGTALLYQLARFTDLGRLCLVEKYGGIAEVNSHAQNNSQTIHCGDIETNYTLDKARSVKRTAYMVINYATKLPAEERDRIIRFIRPCPRQPISSSLCMRWIDRIQVKSIISCCHCAV